MKQLWFSSFLIMTSLFIPTVTSAQSSAKAMLQEMGKVSQSLNYELSYVNINKQGIDSLRYRHAISEGKPLAQLLYMDGTRAEVLQQGNKISYFNPGIEPFTLPGNYIIDALPSIVFSNFEHLAKFYNYIAAGRARVADRLCQVIRVVPRDGSRYSYIIWLDEINKLPMRVDLLDRDSETLEQFRVISFSVNDSIKAVLQDVKATTLPPLLTLPIQEKNDFDWLPQWLPEGIIEVSRSRSTLSDEDKPVESRFYTDGLFSFSINVSPVNKNKPLEQYFRQGRRSIQTAVRANMEITVVGEIPSSTAKRITDNIIIKSIELKAKK